MCDRISEDFRSEPVLISDSEDEGLIKVSKNESLFRDSKDEGVVQSEPIVISDSEDEGLMKIPKNESLFRDSRDEGVVKDSGDEGAVQLYDDDMVQCQVKLENCTRYID